MNSHHVLVSRWSVEASRDEVWDAVDQLRASDDPMTWWPWVRPDRDWARESR